MQSYEIRISWDIALMISPWTKGRIISPEMLGLIPDGKLLEINQKEYVKQTAMRITSIALQRLLNISSRKCCGNEAFAWNHISCLALTLTDPNTGHVILITEAEMTTQWWQHEHTLLSSMLSTSHSSTLAPKLQLHILSTLTKYFIPIISTTWNTDRQELPLYFLRFQRFVETAVVGGWLKLKLIKFHRRCSLKRWGPIQRTEGK